MTKQRTEDLFDYSVVVVDNDEKQSARQIVRQFAGSAGIEITYCVESRKNIALARNMALDKAYGDFVAFIDDDEFPDPDWLINLYRTCIERNVAGVLGPVKPHFDEEPPAWVLKGRLFDRPEHATGFVMHWKECRTGNVLFRKSIIENMEPVFSPEFATGGEDVDFFRRIIGGGHTFVWCNEAAVHEHVPRARLKRGFMIRRALLRGRNNMRHPAGRVHNILKSLIAFPFYLLLLPFTQLAGHHHFIKFLIKLCDHGGRLLAFVGLNPVRERDA